MAGLREDELEAELEQEFEFEGEWEGEYEDEQFLGTIGNIARGLLGDSEEEYEL